MRLAEKLDWKGLSGKNSFPGSKNVTIEPNKVKSIKDFIFFLTGPGKRSRHSD
jgi:hypothetical protein